MGDRAFPRRRILALAAAAALAAGSAPALAHVVVTTDGKTYEGKILSQDADKVVIETTFEGTKEIPKAQVKSVDDKVPPLRFQLGYRLEQAGKDVAALTDLAAWAKAKGFGKEVDVVWEKVVDADPKNVKAHKALGHVLVGAAWMTPEQKAAAEKAAEEAALRAKGLVPYQGRWVTPEEKEALEKGLMKDGDEWVSEDEWHRRRSETKVDGKWIRVGEEQGKARAAALSKALSVTLVPLWGPHVDVYHELKPEDGQAVLAAAEKAWDAFASIVKPGEKDGLLGLRVEVACFEKAPAYARYSQKFADENEVAKINGLENWATQAGRQRGWWWPHPTAATGQYFFPNTLKALQSGVAHNLVAVWLTRWRFNWQFSRSWLREGLAYAVEMRAIGYSQSYTVGKGGAAGADPATWQDSAKWKDSLKALVAASQDTPAGRLLPIKDEQNQLTLPDLVKCWSLVDFLAKRDPAKFRTFLAATKIRAKATENERTDEDALREAFGIDARALEAAWRAWVQAGFSSP